MLCKASRGLLCGVERICTDLIGSGLFFTLFRPPIEFFRKYGAVGSGVNR